MQMVFLKGAEAKTEYLNLRIRENIENEYKN